MPQHEVVVGIDPGLKGSLVCMQTQTGDLLDKIPMPKNIIPDVYRWLFQIKNTFPTLCIGLEKPLMMKGRSSLVGSFTSGRNFGCLEAAIRLLYVPFHIIPPQSWTHEMHKGIDGKDSKDRSLIVAKNIWPCEKFTYNEKQLKPNEGIVDAMLIAEYLRRRIK